MEKVIQTFEGLIRRGLAPSVTFFLVLALGERIRVKLKGGEARDQVARLLTFVTSSSLANSPTLLLTFAVLSIIGLSYGLQAIQQIAFDNRLKEDFHPWLLSSRNQKKDWNLLKTLRGKVVQRLTAELDFKELRNLPEYSDYLLYEILGGIVPMDTRPFVDAAKAVGIFFVSVVLVLVGNILVLVADACISSQGLNGWALLVLSLLTVAFLWGGMETTRSLYRARALRLYINFLALPTQRIHRILLEGKGPSSEEKKKDS